MSIGLIYKQLRFNDQKQVSMAIFFRLPCRPAYLAILNKHKTVPEHRLCCESWPSNSIIMSKAHRLATMKPWWRMHRFGWAAVKPTWSCSDTTLVVSVVAWFLQSTPFADVLCPVAASQHLQSCRICSSLPIVLPALSVFRVPLALRSDWMKCRWLVSLCWPSAQLEMSARCVIREALRGWLVDLDQWFLGGDWIGWKGFWDWTVWLNTQIGMVTWKNSHAHLFLIVESQWFTYQSDTHIVFCLT